MRLNLPNMGFMPQGTVEQRHEDMANIRPVEGTGGPFLVCPGLLELQGVATRGLQFEERVERSSPINGDYARMLEWGTTVCSLTHALDGTPLVERSIFSNFAVWQPGEIFYVRGRWDPEVSPPLEDLRPLERIHRPVLTTGEVTADGEVRVQSGRGRKE
jgi:hypothetical protein